MFGKKNQTPQEVTSGRFEVERDGKTAYLQYSLGGGILVLEHTEVPKELRGHGLATTLNHSAFEYARENDLRVDVVCPSSAAYLADHPEYQVLVLK